MNVLWETRHKREIVFKYNKIKYCRSMFFWRTLLCHFPSGCTAACVSPSPPLYPEFLKLPRLFFSYSDALLCCGPRRQFLLCHLTQKPRQITFWLTFLADEEFVVMNTLPFAHPLGPGQPDFPFFFFFVLIDNWSYSSVLHISMPFQFFSSFISCYYNLSFYTQDSVF